VYAQRVLLSPTEDLGLVPQEAMRQQMVEDETTSVKPGTIYPKKISWILVDFRLDAAQD